MIIKKIVSVQGEFAKPGVDIKDGDMVKLLNEGVPTQGKFGERLTFKVETKNGPKNISLNQTTLNNLVDAFGEDSRNWIGKPVKAWVMKAMVSGKLSNIVYLALESWVMNDDGRFTAAGNGEVDPNDVPM